MNTKLAIAFLSLPIFATGCGDNISSDGPLAGDEDPGPGNGGGSGNGGGEEVPTSGPCSMNAGMHSVTVALHDKTGSVLETGETGVDGIVAFDDCPRDAMISIAAYDEDEGWKGATIAGVQPFSDLTVVLPAIGWQGTLMAEVPEDGADVTNEYVTMASQCGAGSDEGASQEVPILAGCLGYDADVLSVLATGRIDGVWVYSHSEDVDIIKNGVTNVGLEDMTAWMTGGQLPMTATNIDADGAGFLISWMRNGQPYYSSSWGATLNDGTIERSLPVPPTTFSRQRMVGARKYDGLNASGYLYISDQEASIELDLGDSLAYIGSVALNNDDTERPTFTATEVPSGTDMTVFRSSWDIEGENVDWRLIVPSSATSTIRFPELPEELGKAVPTETSAVTSVNVVDITGNDYLDILTTGYNIDKYQNYCGELDGDNRCRFASLQNP